MPHEDNFKKFGIDLDFQKIKKSKDPTEFLEIVLFPISKFKNFEDYYHEASCINRLDKVET